MEVSRDGARGRAMTLVMLAAMAASVAAFAPSSSLFTSSTLQRQQRAALPASAARLHMTSDPRSSTSDPHSRGQNKAYQQYNTVTFRDVPHPNPSAEAAQRLHVHFGAGRLGLGLVMGCVEASGDSFAIVQRPNAEWNALPRGSRINLTVNNKAVSTGVEVVSTEADISQVLSRQGDNSERVRMLATTEEEAALLALASRATSFSCSLGPAMNKVLVPLLSKLPERPAGERPVLYACENDHGAAKAVGARLRGRVDLRCCMVDRICTSRTIGNGAVDVGTEAGFSGSLVVLDPQVGSAAEEAVGAAQHVPFAGAAVAVPSSTQEAKYLYDRKFSLVNGMHTVLAFMTLRENGEHSDLMTYSTADTGLRAQMWAWATARCLMLVSEYGMDTIKSAHGVATDDEALDSLLTYAWSTLGRFSAVEDTTARVLGGGVRNRWATRLWPVTAFLKLNGGARAIEDDPRSAGARLLHRAGVPPELAEQCTADLVTEGLQFCAPDINKTVDTLMAFYKRSNRSQFPGREHPDVVSHGESEEGTAYFA